MTDHSKDSSADKQINHDTNDSAVPEDSGIETNEQNTDTQNLKSTDNNLQESDSVANKDLTNTEVGNLGLGDLGIGDLNVDSLNINSLDIDELEVNDLGVADLELGSLDVAADIFAESSDSVAQVNDAESETSDQELELDALTSANVNAIVDSEVEINNADNVIDDNTIDGTAALSAIVIDEAITDDTKVANDDAINLNKAEDAFNSTEAASKIATKTTVIAATDLIANKEELANPELAEDNSTVPDSVVAVPFVKGADTAEPVDNGDMSNNSGPNDNTAAVDDPIYDYANANQSFTSAFLQTLAAVFKDKGALLMIIAAPIIYGFFYPWPYSAEVVNQVPVGIIDYDHSSLSNTLVRYSAASPQLKTQPFVNEQAAIEAIWHNEIAGYMIIPAGLEKKVKSSQPASVSVIGNGGYLLLNKNVQIGFLKAVSTVSAGVEIKKSVAQGAYSATAKANTQAVPLHITPLYNPSEGYGAYVVPGVSILILQQTLMMGTALLISTLYEQRRHHTSARGWLGRIFALSLLGFIMGCFYYGWVFDSHDYARGANLTGSLVFLAVYFPAVAALGCLLGLWFRERERGLQILIVSSLPIFFVSDYPWPADQLPTILQYLRWLIPSSSGINTSVQLNQMGASLTQVMPRLFILAALFVVYYTAILLLESIRNRRAVP